MKIYNALTRVKEEFIPLVENQISMYICGVTVYDSCHIGHARCYVNFDVLRRYFLYRGYSVRLVQNFTDIDDKIIIRARDEKAQGGIEKSVKDLTQRFIKDYFDKMDRLGVLRADQYPRATECVNPMIDMIQILVDKKHAYIVEGDVFFSVDTFSDYGMLSGKNIDDLRSGERVKVDIRKKNPLDFALWKSAKPEEPSWESPWGRGRPGWHIECSAMAFQAFGASFDIHAGGKDLIFPHHENERAQSHCCTNKKMASYWMHNGFVTVNKEKMSKSLNNFFLLSDIYTQYNPEVLRLFLLSSHYRSPIDFLNQSLEQSKEQCHRGYMMLNNARIKIGKDFDENPFVQSQIKSREIIQLYKKWLSAMDDDLNTALAIGCLFEVVQAANLLIKKDSSHFSEKERDNLIDYVRLFKEISSVLFLFQREYRCVAENSNPRDSFEKTLQELLLKRKTARKDKDWVKADMTRKEILAICPDILLEDTSDRTFVFFRNGSIEHCQEKSK